MRFMLPGKLQDYEEGLLFQNISKSKNQTC